MYRCEAVSIAGFIQQLAVAYVANGYWLYVTGCVPPQKDPRAVDAKLIDRYGIDCSKFVRCRRKGRGLGNVQYLRFRRFFVLLATPGEHDFLIHEADIQDIRRRPIKCFGYSVGCYRGRAGTRWHPSVRIERALFQEIKADFLGCAKDEVVETLRERFHRLPFEPYAPVRRQALSLLGGVNTSRRLAGLETVPLEALRLRRSPVMPFGAGVIENAEFRVAAPDGDRFPERSDP
jgi:hypothetical protein